MLGEERDGEPLSLTGPLGHVTPGEQLVCAGAFAEHPRHGWQFVVASFHSALPQSAEGIELWLTRRVPGIGPTFARAIVEHFGAEHVFEELDRDPERLREVRTKAGRAISRKSVERAIAAWREVATIREVESFLFTHGIGAGLAARLVREYGDDVVGVLTQDPYRLTELRGIGFKIADRIARSLGIELDAPQRLRAGLLFVLEEAESDGNVYPPARRALARRGPPPRRRRPRAARVGACARSSPGRRSSSRTSASTARSSGRWSSASARRSARARVPAPPSSSRSRAAPTCRCRTSSGASSSSCARGRSCC